jgi:hypothetical protein
MFIQIKMELLFDGKLTNCASALVEIGKQMKEESSEGVGQFPRVFIGGGCSRIIF